MMDLHVHTARCGHAEGTLQQYVDAAKTAGVETLAFCDHLPLPPHQPQGYAMEWPELPEYIADVKEAAELSARAGGPEILLGIEADWIPGYEVLVSGASELHGFD